MRSKLQYLGPLILLLSSMSYAQDLSNLPSCAQSPALSAIGSTGCQANDFACLCKDNSFINAALAGAETQCSQSDLQKVLTFARQICSSVGVSLTVSASAQGSSTPPPPSSSPSPLATSPVATGTQTSSHSVSASASPSSSAVAAATGQASATAASAVAASGAGGRDAGVGWWGVVWGGAVVGWWVLIGGGA